MKHTHTKKNTGVDCHLERALSRGHSCLTCRPQSGLQSGVCGAFGKRQGAVASVHIGQVIMSIRTKLQNKEQVKFKFPDCCKIHRSGDLLSLMWMKLKTWWWKSSLSQRAVGSNMSLFPALWTNGGPCAPESPDTVPSLTPTGKSYFKGFFSPCIKAVWDEDFDVLIIILNFHLVGRCQLRWKEDLGNRSPWVFGSHPTMSVPEKRVHDNELAVENTSASRQGKHLSCWKRIFKCL